MSGTEREAEAWTMVACVVVAALGAVVSLAGCGAETAFYVIEGPADFRLDGTTFSPGVAVNVDESGRVFLGPDYPDFYFLDEAPEAIPDEDP